MPPETKPRKMLKQKTRVMGLLQILIIVLFFFVLNKLFEIDLFFPLVFFAAGIFFIFIIPRFRKARRMRHYPPLLEREELFEEEADLLLSEFLGKEIFELLYNEELEDHSEYGIDICQDLLQRREVQNNPVLQAHIYTKMAGFREKSGDWTKAVEHLAKAARLHPEPLVLYYRLAQNHERLGSADEAVQSYTAALRAPGLDSPSLKRFFRVQIDRIRKYGPKQEPPP